MGQWVVFIYPMVSHKVPTTLMTPYSYPMGHYSYSFVREISRKWFKNMFLTMLTSITSYSIHKYVLWANKWCSIILWYHTRCLLHSWPDIVTHCHSHSFVSINGQKWLKHVLLMLNTNMFYGPMSGFSIILKYHPNCLLQSWPNIFTLWATIAK
jgi:hypothetical protein